MREALEFVFSSFWTWLGCAFLIACFRPIRIINKNSNIHEEVDD